MGQRDIKRLPIFLGGKEAKFDKDFDFSKILKLKASTHQYLIMTISSSIYMMCNRLMHPFLKDGNTSEGKEELVKVVLDKVAKGGGRQKTKPGVIQRQLTSLGRFTLRSQTEENPSIIAFFLALAHDSDKELSLHDFQSTWEKRVMEKHERFRCQVSREDDHFFEVSNLICCSSLQ